MEEMITEPYEIIENKLAAWATGFFEMLPNLLVAVIVLAIFFFLARLVKRYSAKLLSKVVKYPTIVNVVSLLLYYFVLLEGLFLALDALHLEKTVTSLLAGIGVIGLGLSFAFQNLATNFVSGVILALERPVKIGDLVEVAGQMGNVHAIHLRTVQIQTFDGQLLYVPSKDMIENSLKNYTSTNGRRVKVSVGVSYGEDLEMVREITLEAVAKQFNLNKPDILFNYTGFGDSSINFDLYFWITSNDQEQFLLAHSEAVIAIKKAYDQHDINIPFPIRTLDFGIKGGEKMLEQLQTLESWKANNS